MKICSASFKVSMNKTSRRCRLPVKATCARQESSSHAPGRHSGRLNPMAGKIMDRIKNILVIVDPTSPDQPAVQKAGMLAARLQASVELFACDTKVAMELRSARQWARRGAAPSMQLDALLEGLAGPLRSQGIEVTTSGIQGDPMVKVILNWLKNSPADLVLKDTHHHSLAKRTFLGNTDWHLIRECPFPLLLTKPGCWREPLVVAAAIDPRITGRDENFLDRRILDCTVAIGRPMHATIIAAHSYYPDIISAASTCPQPNFFNVTAEMLSAEKTLHVNALASLLAPYQDCAAICASGHGNRVDLPSRDRGAKRRRHHGDGRHLAQSPEANADRRHGGAIARIPALRCSCRQRDAVRRFPALLGTRTFPSTSNAS